MVASLEWMRQVRDETHNLNINLPEHKRRYEASLEGTLMRNELNPGKDGKYEPEKWVYPDSVGKKTVGVGFNMDGEDAEKQWRRAFGGRISFQAVYDKKIPLPKEDGMHLLKTCIQIRREELQKHFGETWLLFRANERLAIEELYYNCKTLIRHYNPKTGLSRSTNFSYDMKLYALYKDCRYLHAAREEILLNSNRNKDPGIQNRRNGEAELLASDVCPIYSKPGEAFIPANAQINLVLGQTITPYKHGNENCLYSPHHYIWRTSCDNRVRNSHRANEGKIFSVDSPPPTGHPGADYGCRCEADYYIPSYVALPKYNMFHGRLIYKGSLEYFIRHGNEDQSTTAFVIM